jgi:hypothetical protein
MRLRAKVKATNRVYTTMLIHYSIHHSSHTPTHTLPHTTATHCYTQIDDGDVMMRLDATHEHWGWKDSR